MTDAPATTPPGEKLSPWLLSRDYFRAPAPSEGGR
jgi:hypothetical protein